MERNSGIVSVSLIIFKEYSCISKQLYRREYKGFVKYLISIVLKLKM
jgi:hypothetical protein